MLGRALPVLEQAELDAAAPPPRRASARRACAGSPRRGGRPSAARARARRRLRVALAVRRRAGAPRARARSARPGSRASSGAARAGPRRRAPAAPAAASFAAGPAPRRSNSRERLEQRLLVVRLGERPRRLVRAAVRAPGRRRRVGVAVELQPVRLGDPVRRLAERARLPLPVRELAREPEVALLERERVDRARLLERPLARRRRARPPRRARRGRVRAAAGGRPAARARAPRRARPARPGRRGARAAGRARSARVMRADRVAARVTGALRVRRALVPPAAVDVHERRATTAEYDVVELVRLRERDVLAQVAAPTRSSSYISPRPEPSMSSARARSRSSSSPARATSRLSEQVRRCRARSRRPSRARCRPCSAPYASVSSSPSASASCDRLLAPGDALRVVAGEHAGVRLVGVGARELAAGRQRLEQLDRARGSPPRPRRSGPPRMYGDRQPRRACSPSRERGRRARGRARSPRSRASIDSGVAAGDSRLVRVRGEQRARARPPAAPSACRSARAYCAAASRCAPAAAARSRRRRRVLEHRRRVARLLGVVGEPGDVAAAAASARRIAACSARRRFGDDARSRPRAGRARAGTRRRRRPRAARRTRGTRRARSSSPGATASSSQSSTRAGTTDDDVEQPRARRARGAPTRASTASRTVSGSVCAAGREDLGDVERVAVREPVDRVARRRPCGSASVADGVEREPRHRQPRDPRRRRELAEHDARADAAVDLVVAVGRERRATGVASIRRPSTRSDVERRLVGPVQVLEHEQRRPLELVAAAAVRDAAAASGRRESSDRATSSERPERRRRRQALAGAVQDATPDARRERAHERRLADAGLAADEHEPPALGARRLELARAASSRSRSAATTVTASYRVCGKPRSTFDVAGSGQREVTTLPRV